MICPDCYGKGARGSVEWNGVRVCPECQGSGIVSCCDAGGSCEDLTDDAVADFLEWVLKQPTIH